MTSLPPPVQPVTNDVARARLLRDGYLRLPQLVPVALCEAAHRAIWRTIPYQPDEPAAWPHGGRQFHECNQLPEVRACFTARVLQAIDELAGAGLHRQSNDATRHFYWPIVTFPGHPGGGPHIDQHGPIHRTMVFGLFLHLHDVGPVAGGTWLWPGSYREVEDEALRRRCLPIRVAGSGATGEPVQLTAACGDAVIWLRNQLHAPGPNRSATPRVGMQTLVHLNETGEAHCRSGAPPRTPVEQIYDRHRDAYEDFNYFDCTPENRDSLDLYGLPDGGSR